MNEVEKLYINAGIKTVPQKTKDCTSCYYYEEAWDAPCDVCSANKCPFEKNIMPPFTAEKQIKMLELILKKRRILDIGYIIEQEKYTCMHYKRTFNSFEEALCADINYHYQDLTEEEKQQIKEILK